MFELNACQTPIEELHLEQQPQEVQDQFWDYFNNVPYIKSLVSAERKRACDLPRDEEGKIIINLEEPHILEDMDYFRPAAIKYQESGRYTDLQPNGNPNSAFYKFVMEEVRRCWEGYVRPWDGEWITGDNYYFLNYCPILQSKTDEEVKKPTSYNEMKKVIKIARKRKTLRVSDFPKVWELHYYKFHYLNQARDLGRHAMELARRGCGKSYTGASLLGKRFVLGESQDVDQEVQCVVTAYERKYISGANQILDMFKKYIDFLALNTQFPSRRLVDSQQLLQWKMGYKDLDTGAEKGTLNSVIGITSKDDESKLRGSRGVLYLVEEMGSFPRLLALYSTMRPSVEDGDDVFGMLYLYGTAGDESSDFAAAQEIMYHPKGYNVHWLNNIYDKVGQGTKFFTLFSPSYVNRARCYDDNGNSDVTKALFEILVDRYSVKYNSSDMNAITKRIAELPITPQEAIIKARGSIFPVSDLNTQLNVLDNNPHIYDNVYVGTLGYNAAGTLEFIPTNDTPIRDFPLKDNKNVGAIEFYDLPKKNSRGEVESQRYIIGHDPVDDDDADTMSLTSTFVFDMFTDSIVAEYTGRQVTADQNFEIVRRLALFYNAKVLYESNKKGIYAYFDRYHCLYLLAETPTYLRDREELISSIGAGNKGRGVHATEGINNYANRLIRDWLIKPIKTLSMVEVEKEDGTKEDVEMEVVNLNLTRVLNRALIKECISFNKDGNFDRIRALGMAMLYREQYLAQYGGDVEGNRRNEDTSLKLEEDPLLKQIFARNGLS